MAKEDLIVFLSRLLHTNEDLEFSASTRSSGSHDVDINCQAEGRSSKTIIDTAK